VSTSGTSMTASRASFPPRCLGERLINAFGCAEMAA
jgi:hypothetical protein